MNESEKPFTVSDRRHFTPDGRPRDAAETEAAAEIPGARAASPEDALPTTPPTAAPRVGTGPAGSRDGARPPTGPADFSEFLLSLAAQAGILLSGRGLPEGADAADAREGVRSIISILEMLRDKTEGRRTAREDEVLEGLLFELRMAYVESSRASGS